MATPPTSIGWPPMVVSSCRKTPLGAADASTVRSTVGSPGCHPGLPRAQSMGGMRLSVLPSATALLLRDGSEVRSVGGSCSQQGRDDREFGGFAAN